MPAGRTGSVPLPTAALLEAPPGAHDFSFERNRRRHHRGVRQNSCASRPDTGPDRARRFSYRASVAAWAEYWQPAPRPGFHDLLALTKRGEAVLEGDLHPFMTHLQYFKDVLALPRHFATVVS